MRIAFQPKENFSCMNYLLKIYGRKSVDAVSLLKWAAAIYRIKASFCDVLQNLLARGGIPSKVGLKPGKNARSTTVWTSSLIIICKGRNKTVYSK